MASKILERLKLSVRTKIDFSASRTLVHTYLFLSVLLFSFS